MIKFKYEKKLKVKDIIKNKPIE